MSSLLFALLSLLSLFLLLREWIRHKAHLYLRVMFFPWLEFHFFWHHDGFLKNGHAHLTVIFGQTVFDRFDFSDLLNAIGFVICSKRHSQVNWGLKIWKPCVYNLNFGPFFWNWLELLIFLCPVVFVHITCRCSHWSFERVALVIE